jgi:hypothetical protein
MSADLLASVAASLGLKQIEPDGVACGFVDGFPTQLALTEGKKSIRVLFRHAGEDNDIELRAAIAQSPEVKASGLRLPLVAVSCGTVTLLITDRFVRVPSEEVILLRMRAVLQVLAAVSTAPAPTCRLCGSETGAEPVLWDGIVDLVCPACVARVEEEAQQAAAEYRSRAANWPLGFVCAISVGAVGAVVHVSVITVTGRMFWAPTIVTGMMVGVAALIGTGKGGLAVQAMAAIVTVVSVLAGELGYFAYGLNHIVTAQGGSVDWVLFVARSPMLLVGAWMNTLFSLCSGLAAAAVAIRYTQPPEFNAVQTASKPPGPGNLSPP